MNNFHLGKFIHTPKSSKPAIIINNNNNYNDLLVSIHEYNGDYIFCSRNNALLANLNIEHELSILANFENWFYDQHKLLYQEKIINCIIYYNT